MAYDEELADRVRAQVEQESGLTERRMFGGLAFLINGHMAVAASTGGLMVRIEPADTEELLRAPHARPMEMRGRELNGWLRLDVDVRVSDEELAPWIRRGVAYARSLPPK